MTTFEKLKSMDDAHAKTFIAMVCTKAYIHGVMAGIFLGDNPDATTKGMFKEFYMSLDKEEPSETEVKDA